MWAYLKHRAVDAVGAKAAGIDEMIRGGTAHPDDVNMVQEAMRHFCLLHLDRSVPDVPIYEVAVASDVVAREDAIIVGYVRVPSFDSVPLPHFGGVLACTMAPA